MKRGRFEEATPLLAQAVTLGEQLHGPDHPALISSLASLAELFWRQGQYEQAEAVMSRILA
ncbi:MAG: tetratricopeptide repeat protein, partial [Ktedonobacteraceae bacterium]|nr:tetratricopeptide repeat protein [Ktedonobacteraceae bacterium]